MSDITQLTPSHGHLAGGAVVPVTAPTTTTILAERPTGAAITIVPDDGSGEISIPSSAYSLQGFREWATSANYPERGQMSFSPEGLIVDMSPELLESHNYVKTDIGLTLVGLVRQLKLGRFIGDRALYSNEQADVSTEPDALLISGPALSSGRCLLVESKRPGLSIEIQGAPDWILEVVSPTSVKKDKVTLRDGYFKAGVGEYWIVDALGEEIEFLVLIPGADAYVSVEPKDGWLASPTFGRSFRLSVEKDADGFAHYTLHVQENS